MKTDEIEKLANRGNVATADFDVKLVLRTVVIPAFLDDCREAAWRKKVSTLSVTQSVQTVDLPDDFQKVLQISPGEGNRTLQYLRYIGEDPDAMLAAEACITPGSPTGYYITKRLPPGGTVGEDEVWKRLKFDVIPATSFTAYYIYMLQPYFGGALATKAVNMDPYVPANLQAGLVHGLRAQILIDRYGEGDTRAKTEQEQRERYVSRALGSQKDFGRQNYATFAR